MSWPDVDLLNFTLVAAPHGGALGVAKVIQEELIVLALIRDEGKTYTYPRIGTTKSGIFIYSSSGKLIKRVPWDGKKICGSGWTNNEKLVIVAVDGTVRYYDLRGHFSQFSLGEDAALVGVHECQFWQSGLVALLQDGRYMAVSNLLAPRPRMLASHGLTIKQIHCWSILAPQHTLSRDVEILIATRQTILLVDVTESQDQLLEQGPFSRMSVSPNGNFLALYSPQGKLWVVSTDLQRNLSEFDTEARIEPKQIAWCGDNSVILTWNNLLLMVGPFGGATSYTYEDAFWVFTDTDGARIVSQTKCEFLQRVPDYVEDVFKVGATSPAAVLLDATDHLDKKSAKADENVQIIRPHLTEAVETCIKAAGFEFSHYWQKQLLKAASFGKAFLDFYNSDSFVEMCDYLRVLNAIRNFELGPENLIDRLLDRQQHLLAVRISEHLRLPLNKIYVHWACTKVRLTVSDDESVCRMIVEKLASRKDISYEDIAKTAYEEGKVRLATKEPLFVQRQVPLLLLMKEYDIALKKAVESDDPDQINFVLLELKKTMPLPQYFRLLNDKPVAARFFEKLAEAQNDKALLKDFYYQDDRRGDSAYILLREGFETTDRRERLDLFHLAAKMFGEDKEHAFEAKAVEEQVRLLQFQQEHEKNLQLYKLSLTDTIFELLKSGDASKALKLKTDFKVSDKQFWWIKLRALIGIRDFSQIEAWSKSKKSPIGYEPFFYELLAAGNTRLAATFIPKCDPGNRVEFYLKVGDWSNAGKIAFAAKDLALLEDIRSKASNTLVTGELDAMISLLTKPAGQ